MAELTAQERLQPSLLDRLTDENADQGLEARDQRLISWQRLREIVRRDLAMLLNCVNLEASEDLSAWPAVARSTVNFGIPDIAGTTIASVDVDVLQKRVRQAILDFEPRLIRQKLVVKVEAERRAMNRKSLVFLIEGEIWAQPTPQSISVRTEFDLETGTVRVDERRA